MINDTFYWLTNLYKEEYLMAFSGILLLDGPRYMIANTLLMLSMFFNTFFKGKEQKPTYLPMVSVVIPCLNEDATIYHCLESLYGSYPYLQMIVVDDGSTDKTYELSMLFAQTHKDIIVLKRSRRGGKSSAQNFALPYVKGEIVAVVDSDSTFGENAIFKLIQPFLNPKVGGTSGSILVRNPNDSLCTLFQSYEYLLSIMVGRILSSKLGVLSIISGAFGAFRKEIFDKGYGMDVGPSEDSDITIRIRKMGYDVIFVPEAECFTDVPVSWISLWKQRIRWDMGIVRMNMRKHINVTNIFHNNFRLSNAIDWWDGFIFSVVSTLSFWVVLLWMFLTVDYKVIIYLSIITFGVYLLFGVLQVMTIIFHSTNLKRDILPCIIFPLYPFYGGLFMRAVRTVAIIDEYFNQSSFKDNYVPDYVQKKTWEWNQSI